MVLVGVTKTLEPYECSLWKSEVLVVAHRQLYVSLSLSAPRLIFTGVFSIFVVALRIRDLVNILASTVLKSDIGRRY